MTSYFPPEGRLLNTPENRAACASPVALRRAMEEKAILEGVVRLCDAEHNLIVSLGAFTGLIPRAEAALGIADGSTREIAILSRVGKPVCFLVESVAETDGVIRPVLSRRLAQEAALNAIFRNWRPGTVISATVTHLEPFGAFVDVGCGISSMIGIENISVSRIPHPDQRFAVGQEIFAVVQDLVPDQRRVYLTHKELLGTWSENAAAFQPGMTVPGIIRGQKEYGVFVELTPNLSGLAELRGGFQEGDRVSVYLKALLPERMKIKLLMIDRLPPLRAPEPLRYFITSGQLEQWRYAPAGCRKVGAQTVFAD